MLITDLRILQWVRPLSHPRKNPVQIVALRSGDYSIWNGNDPKYLVTCVDNGVYYDFMLDEIELIE